MIKLFKNLEKRDWVFLLFGVIFIVIQVWLDLKLPDYMSSITMLVQTEGSAMSEILGEGGKMLLCALGSFASAIMVSIVAARVASNFSANIRGKLFHKVQEFSMEEIGRFSTASLITRSTNDVQQVQIVIVMGLQAVIKAPILAIWAVLKIYNKSWQWTASTGVAVVVLFTIMGICMMFALPKFKKMQVLTDDLNRVTRENLTGLSVVRAYNAEQYQEEKFDVANTNLMETNMFAFRTMAFLMPGIQGIMNGLALSIYWIGAVLINQAQMDTRLTLFSDMVVFSSYAMQVVMAFMMLVMIFMILPRATVAAKRILEVFDTKITIKDGKVKNSDVSVVGDVEFRNVSFHYPDAAEDAITDLSFHAKKGETVALIGATGCGKSTVVNLIPRFYDVTGGSVLVDGIDVREYKQTELRDKIGYVSQKAILFSGDKIGRAHV